MPILHGVPLSPFVRKARVALAEKAVAYESDPVLPFGQTDEYKRKSPLGKIPCWEDGDFVLPDSSCIIAYLERAHPNPRLYPEDPQQFGRALWYEEYADSKLVECATPVFFQRFVQKNFFQQEPDEAVVAAALEALNGPLTYLEGEIGDREYLVGNHFSIADLATGAVLVNLHHGGERVDASRYPKFAAYVDRIHARPSFKEIIEGEKAGMPG